MATNGGGATHVSIGYSGRLDEFKTSGMEDRLIVVAGGGAGSYKGESNNFYGGSGGGYIGGNPRVNDTEIAGCGGTQTEGYDFGKGEPGYGNIGGGGSGWYGGIIGDATDIIPIIYEVTVDGTSATVKYAIPSGASNIRLVYKAGSVPASRSDGTYVSITQSSTSYTVTGLARGNTYYFVIFIGTTVKSEPCSIDISPVPPEYQQYIETMNGTGLFCKDWVQPTDFDGSSYRNCYPTYDHSYLTHSYFSVGQSGFGDGKHVSVTKNIASIYITENNGQYTCELNPTLSDDVVASPSMSTSNPNYSYSSGRIYSTYTSPFWNRAPFIFGGNTYVFSPITLSYNSLDTMFQYLVRIVANVNIYVNGVCWSQIG